ncbi:hypothetical protein Tco_1312680 [Tanacetum coccineum]
MTTPPLSPTARPRVRLGSVLHKQGASGFELARKGMQLVVVLVTRRPPPLGGGSCRRSACRHRHAQYGGAGYVCGFEFGYRKSKIRVR